MHSVYWEQTIKTTPNFHASRRLRFEDTKRIISPEKFQDFRETGPICDKQLKCDSLRTVIRQMISTFTQLENYYC